MKKISRLAIAALIVGVLAVIATGTWAAPKFQGTTPALAETGESTDGSEISMGDATIDPTCTDCKVMVKVADVPAPDDKQFVSRPLEVTIEGTGSVVLTFPPATGDAKLYKYNVDTKAWEEVTTAVVNADGSISVEITEGGIYAVMAAK